jgi:hypothetical protein
MIEDLDNQGKNEVGLSGLREKEAQVSITQLFITPAMVTANQDNFNQFLFWEYFQI